MPVLDELCTLSVSDAALYLLAVIHCPRDEAERKALFARMQNSQAQIAIRRPEGELALWRVLQGLAGDRLTRQDSDRTTGAKICAYMFMRALVDGASLTDVVKELHERPHRLGESSCWRYWSEYRPAVHLGTAYHFWRGLWQPGPLSRKNLTDFLVIAEGLRQRGEAHVMRGQALLDPKESWRADT
jgi:hypothetical protein